MKTNRASLLGSAVAAALLGGSIARAADAPVQPQDAEYGRLIDQYLVDKRFTSELVDHMPASDTVPSPLKFLAASPARPAS